MKPHIKRSRYFDGWSVYLDGYRHFQHRSFMACCCWCHLSQLGVRFIDSSVRVGHA